MKRKTNTIIIFIALISILSCGDDSCCKEIRKRIDIPVNVVEGYKSSPENYCCVLKLALDNDKESLKKVSLFDFSDGFIYEQGNTLLELIQIVGEENYIIAIKDISKDDKKKIISYLEAGIDFSENEKFKNKTVLEIYPSLYEFLNQ